MDIDLADALNWVNNAVRKTVGQPLRTPEIVILKGTWRGLTYERMAEESEYSTNYLMRDVAPKLWKQLSGVLGCAVGKTNFRIVLSEYLGDYVSGDYVSDDYAKKDSTETGSPARQQLASSAPSDRPSSLRLERSSVEMSPLLASGYEGELAQIEQWFRQRTLPNANGCFVGIWGIKGVGKSLLCERAVARLGHRFDAVVWRSLKSKPLLNDFCSGILKTLENATPSVNKSDLPGAVERLLSLMTRRSILLILESAESILQPRTLAGEYLPGYSPYSEFFQAIASSRSCLLLAGTEGPTDFVTPSGRHKNQHSIYLSGLNSQPATTLLSTASLKTPECWPALIERYQGHPFALQSAARVIREMFNGRVDTFLQQTPSLFTDVIRLLTPSFDRLCELELTILYWLASQQAPISLSEIQQTLPTPVASTDLISALDSLKQRSYLTIRSEVTPPKFQLPALVKAYAVHRLMAQFKNGGMQPSVVTALPMSPTESIINLSSPAPQPVHLSEWFQERFETAWQPLSLLFERSTFSSARLRSTYHLRDETFIKRYKSVVLGVMYKNAQTEHRQTEHKKAERRQSENDQIKQKPSERSFAGTMGAHLCVTLVVAIRQKATELYEICVQVQPQQGADTLPAGLELLLVDAQQKTLSAICAVREDSFIQLPYFQGQLSESFRIKLLLGEHGFSETFLI